MKTRIAEVVREIPFSMIREMSQLSAGYDNVISLGIGEPDFDTPEAICNQAYRDTLKGATHYTPSQGDPELVEAIRRNLNERFGQELSGRQIAVTAGGMGALTAFFRTVLDPGEEVLVPEPHFPAYRAQVEWAGGKMVHVRTRPENRFLPSPEEIEAAVTPRTKALLLNSPGNPTGFVIPGPVLDEIARIAVKHDLLVLSDEVYDRLLYDGLHHDSIYTRPGMPERTAVVCSFSKTFAMTGWRVGYAFGPQWLIEPMIKVVSSSTSCASSVSQRAALAALTVGQQAAWEMTEEFRLRRDLICEGLMQMPGMEVQRPEGAFYIFPDISRITSECRQFALSLLKEEQVVVVPGEAFGPSGKGSIRIAYTVGRDLLHEALERIHRFIRNHYPHCV